MKKISKRNWTKAYKRWHLDNEKRGEEPGCGYCLHAKLRSGGIDCSQCYLGDIIGCCYNSDSVFHSWIRSTSGSKEEKEHADKIFGIVSEHGKELGYLN